MSQKQNVKPVTVKLTDVKPNPNNPRIIKDAKFLQLVKSITEFPQMLELRPLVVDENMVVLGGNMRLRALQEAGYTEVQVIKITTLTEEQKREFIIKDNVAYGEWDMDTLANEWGDVDLNEWGLDVWKPEDVDVNKFFEDKQDDGKAQTLKIVLEYNEEEYNRVVEAFAARGGTRENIVYTLLLG